MPTKPKTWTSAEVLALRKRLGKTQAELAAALRCSPAAINLWESGIRNPSGAATVVLDMLDSGRLKLEKTS